MRRRLLIAFVISLLTVSMLIGGCVPKNEAEIHFRNAVAFMELQMFKEAVIELKNGMRLVEKDKTFAEKPEYRILESLILIFDNKDEEAALILKETIKKNKSYWNAYLLLSSIYLKEKRYKKAAEILESVPISELNYGQLNFVKGLDYFEAEKFDKAIEQFKLAKTQFEQESLSFREESGSLQFIKNNARTMLYYLLGQAHAQIGKLKESLENYEQAKKINPQIPNIDSDITIVRSKIKLEGNPQDATSLNNLGWAYLQKQQKQEAIKAFEKAIRVRPDLALVYNNLGLVYYEEKQYGKAKYYFNKVLRLNNDAQAKFYAHFNLGRIYRRQGYFEKAILNMEEALKLNPSFLPAVKEHRIAVCLLLIYGKQKDKSLFEELGNLYFENGEFDNALKVYEKAPRGPRRYYNLGRVYFEQGNYDKAEKLCRSAIQNNPKYWRAYYLLGLTLKTQGKLDESIDAFVNALKYVGMDSTQEIKNDLGYAYFETGDIKRAVRTWKDVQNDNKNVAK
ncbi:MAG: tetratricopeptide repeat protein, partial [Candidatus Kryptoniota bacterium]